MWLSPIRRFFGTGKSTRRSPTSQRIRPVVETLEFRLAPSATVVTDKPDYAPGSTAIINASGFQPGETVQLQVLHNDGLPNTDSAGNYLDGHAPWLVTDGGPGDLDGIVNGSIQTTWTMDSDAAGSSFELTATGETSNLQAQTVFTDASNSPLFTASISPTADTQNHTLSSYTITVTNTSTGSPTVQMGSVDITIPSGYSNVVLATNSPVGSALETWSANVVGSTIELRATTNGARLAPMHFISISFTATSPSTTGTYTWTSAATDDINFAGNSLTLSGSQPSVTITTGNPAPTTTSISPTSNPEGTADFTLTVNGTNFINSSVVQWNGSPLTTSFVSATRLTATVPAADLTEDGTASVTVVTLLPAVAPRTHKLSPLPSRPSTAAAPRCPRSTKEMRQSRG